MSDDIQETTVRVVPTGDAGREGWEPLKQTWPKESTPHVETIAELGERAFGRGAHLTVNEPGEAKRFIVTQALARADQAAALLRESLAWLRVMDSPLADEHVGIAVDIDGYINVVEVKHGSA